MLNDSTIEIIKQVVEKVGSSTELIIQELTMYYLVLGVLKLVLLAAITMFISRLLSSGLKVIDLTAVKDQTNTDLMYKGIIKTAQTALVVGMLVYSYSSLETLVKVGVAPHIFMLEKAKELTTGK